MKTIERLREHRREPGFDDTCIRDLTGTYRLSVKMQLTASYPAFFHQARDV